MAFGVRNQFGSQSQVMTLNLEKKVPTVSQSVLYPWGYGMALLQEQSIPKRSISAPQQEVVHSRLSALTIQGREAKVQGLLSTIFVSRLPEETRRPLDEWRNQFARIATVLTEQRAFSLGFLVTQILQPKILRASSKGEQDELIRLEEMCRNVLTHFIPSGKTVGQFLSECEEGLLEERIVRKSVSSARQAMIAQMGLQHQTALIIDSRIELACVSVRDRLKKLQESRRGMSEELFREVRALALEVDQLKDELRTQSAVLLVLSQKDQNQMIRLNIILDECKTILQQIQ